ncbi:MAG: hypothetical protein OK438_01545 [Thaumarchaeota archaeon]|nr:hypothetical protein [Nitrososphaerota archaeon]
MGNESSASTTSDKDWQKQAGRRRVFGFFWIFFGVAIVQTLSSEGDTFIHVVDNYIDIALVVVAVIVLLAWWKKSSTKDLQMVNNILSVLAVILLVLAIVTLAGLTGETTAEDLADDIPTLLFGIFMLINRFV